MKLQTRLTALVSAIIIFISAAIGLFAISITENNEVGRCDLGSALRWVFERGWRFDTIEWETTLRLGFLWYRNR